LALYDREFFGKLCIMADPANQRLNAFPIVAFVSTTNADKAKEFYGDTLGLRFVSQDPFAVVFDAHGTMLRVSLVKQFTPQQFTVLGWEVPDADAVAQELSEIGVKCEHFPGLPQDELGIWKAPDGTKVAWFKDPDGNILSISQHQR
jgi:catechol 2,3-dioxygenase-like lactoylglutathione lyase family enzyme